MASIVPGYEYDIFISYRQKDNKYDGWVTDFAENLKRELEATFKEDLGIYFDINPKDGLLETHDVGASVRQKLNCLVFIPVISQTYCDPRGFAWEHEFRAFNTLAKEDKIGRDIRLPGGNVGSRILAVKIHEIDAYDRTLIESEIGGPLRSIEFIYKSPGVNRPLRYNEDSPLKNMNHTFYRDQINKVANAVKEIINGIRNFDKPADQTAGRLTTEPEIMNSPGKSIIVLPFENFSGDPGQEYFSDGLTEEIITDLSKVDDLLVISRSSAMTYKGARKLIREIASEVNVQYVVEGSVRKSADKLRITVQLIDAVNDSHLWAEKFAGTLDDIFEIQDRVSASVVDSLKLKLGSGEKKHSMNLRAYDLYLLGRFFWNKRSEEGLGLSIQYLTQSLEHDDGYALAYAGLADAYYIGADWNYLEPVSAYGKAADYARKALSLNPGIAEAYATLAGIADNFEYDYVKAEMLFKKSISLNPNYATAHQWYADFLVRIGRFGEALTFINKALKLDPFSAVQNFVCGFIHYYNQDYANAIKKFRDSLEMDPDFPYLNFFLFLCRFHSGQTAEAVSEFNKILESDPELSLCRADAEKMYNAGGIADYINYIIELESGKEKPETRYLAILHALSGNNDASIKYISYNIENLISDYQYFAVEPSFLNLHGDARFNELLRKVGYGKRDD